MHGTSQGGFPIRLRQPERCASSPLPITTALAQSQDLLKQHLISTLNLRYTNLTPTWQVFQLFRLIYLYLTSISRGVKFQETWGPEPGSWSQSIPSWPRRSRRRSWAPRDALQRLEHLSVLSLEFLNNRTPHLRSFTNYSRVITEDYKVGSYGGGELGNPRLYLI